MLLDVLLVAVGQRGATALGLLMGVEVVVVLPGRNARTGYHPSRLPSMLLVCRRLRDARVVLLLVERRGDDLRVDCWSSAAIRGRRLRGGVIFSDVAGGFELALRRRLCLLAITPLALASIIRILPAENVVALCDSPGAQVRIILQVPLRSSNCITFLIAAILRYQVVVSLNLRLVLIQSLGIRSLIRKHRSIIHINTVCICRRSHALGSRVQSSISGSIA